MPARPAGGSGMLSEDVENNVISLRFRADGPAVRRALGRVMGRLSPEFSEDDAGTVELTLAEVLNNIVEHAYATRQPGPVRLWLERRGGGLMCRIEDEGRPMPDLTLPEGRMQPVADRIEDLAEGGWGWALIRNLTHDLAYVRAGRTNRLSFRIPLQQASA